MNNNEELIERLRRWRVFCHQSGSNAVAWLLSEAIKALEQDTWISVDDRLPELHERVFILTTDCDGVLIENIAHWNGDFGFLVGGGHKDPDVTFWMRPPPPPPPPKESGLSGL